MLINNLLFLKILKQNGRTFECCFRVCVVCSLIYTKFCVCVVCSLIYTKIYFYVLMIFSYQNFFYFIFLLLLLFLIVYLHFFNIFFHLPYFSETANLKPNPTYHPLSAYLPALLLLLHLLPQLLLYLITTPHLVLSVN